MSETWDIPSAIALYNIDRWGTGYFTINGAGNVQVMPTQTYGNAIALMGVVRRRASKEWRFHSSYDSRTCSGIALKRSIALFAPRLPKRITRAPTKGCFQ